MAGNIYPEMYRLSMSSQRDNELGAWKEDLVLETRPASASDD